MDIEQAKEKILLATLPHVPFDGWTHAALRAGTSDAGFEPGMAVRAFPRGPVEALDYFNLYADRRMLEELESHDLAAMRIRDRIATAVRLRLEVVAAHRESVRRGLSVLALPQNAPTALRSLYRTVDAIWHAAGDTATDFNFYTKRGLLAGVYSATVLYWVNDRSEGFADSWAFLDRRIADVMAVPKTLGRLRDAVAAFPSPFRLFRGPARRY